MTSQPGSPSWLDRRRSMLRVNHAGEYGARRIYQGQLAVLPPGEDAERIRHMAAQEEAHLKEFERLMTEGRARPSLLLPLWHVGGFAMGAASALLGREAAYACTVAVETVIGEHYAAQETELAQAGDPLEATVAKFRADELEHHDTSLEQGALQAPAYPVLNAVFQGVTRLAIILAKKI